MHVLFNFCLHLFFQVNMFYLFVVSILKKIYVTASHITSQAW